MRAAERGLRVAQLCLVFWTFAPTSDQAIVAEDKRVHTDARTLGFTLSQLGLTRRGLGVRDSTTTTSWV